MEGGALTMSQREPTVEEQLAGELPLTQFGRACQKLGIEILPASSAVPLMGIRLGREKTKETGVLATAWVLLTFPFVHVYFNF